MADEKIGGHDPDEFRRLYEKQRRETGADVILDVGAGDTRDEQREDGADVAPEDSSS